ncbi:MAG: FAD-dependent monooxygenase [Proteobacteria bacterium]|nr:FAD-dependent monooxygenase [Pseudomonadota bacterium]
MKVGIIGAGPAGLYFALRMKRRNPGHEIVIVEQNPPDATFGFGVVFSDQALEKVRQADPEFYRALDSRMERWRDLTIVQKDERVPVDGNGFAAIGRLGLLQLLQGLCGEAGVTIEFDAHVQSLERFEDRDLIVAADGVNSMVRELHAEAFRPHIGYLTNWFAWYGTHQVFDTLTLTFRSNGDGAFVAHHYRYSPGMSTFIVELDAATWERAGLEAMSDDERHAYCEQVFAPDLGGHGLIANHSVWRRFPVVRNEHWTHENIVLMGDALRTVHFSIGSGTRFALEDAIALDEAFAEASGDVPAALALFENRRRPLAEKLEGAAANSYNWYEDIGQRTGYGAYDLAYDYMTRSGRMSDARLRETAPRFATAYDERRAARD